MLTGVAQGIITGIRGLCNGLGPALFGFIFYLFHVDLEKSDSPEVTISTMLINGTHISTKPAETIVPPGTEVSINNGFCFVLLFTIHVHYCVLAYLFSFVTVLYEIRHP